MTRAAERLFALVRATLRNRMDDASLFEGTDAAQWREIYDLSSVQGVLAQAWDGMQLLPEAMRPPRAPTPYTSRTAPPGPRGSRRTSTSPTSADPIGRSAIHPGVAAPDFSCQCGYFHGTFIHRAC